MGVNVMVNGGPKASVEFNELSEGKVAVVGLPRGVVLGACEGASNMWFNGGRCENVELEIGVECPLVVSSVSVKSSSSAESVFMAVARLGGGRGAWSIASCRPLLCVSSKDLEPETVSLAISPVRIWFLSSDESPNMDRLKAALCHRFLHSFSDRPGISCAIRVHRLPSWPCRYLSTASSTSVKGVRFSVGSRILQNRSRHCLAVRWWKKLATLPQSLTPCSATKLRRNLSSPSVQMPRIIDMGREGYQRFDTSEKVMEVSNQDSPHHPTSTREYLEYLEYQEYPGGVGPDQKNSFSSADSLRMLEVFILFLVGALTIQGFVGVVERRIKAIQLSMLAETDVKFLSEALLLEGPVMNGYGRGSKKLGVPTANLPHFDKQLRASAYENGVYFGWGVVAGDHECYPVVANIGKSPTFEGQENSVNIVEAHLLGRNHLESGTDGTENVGFDDFYGRELAVALVCYLRPEKKFDGFDALIAQIHRDIDTGRMIHEASEHEVGGSAMQARKRLAPFLMPSTSTAGARRTEGLTGAMAVPVAAEDGAACMWTTCLMEYP